MLLTYFVEFPSEMMLQFQENQKMSDLKSLVYHWIIVTSIPDFSHSFSLKDMEVNVINIFP